MEITKEGDKTVLIVSSSSTNELETCPKKYQYYKIFNLGPFGKKSEKLERGNLFHQMADYYYKGIIAKREDWLTLVEEALLTGRVAATKMDLPPDKTEFALNKFRKYVENYRVEPNWIPLHSETPFSFKLYEDDEVTILYEGKIDLIVQDNGIMRGKLLIVDHKTSEKGYEPSILSNQTLSYLSLGISDTFCINQVGFQKTKDPYHRYYLSAPPNVLEEWKRDTIYWVLQIYKHMKEDYFPRNYRACIWGCPFMDICKEHENMREGVIKFNYHQREAHDLFPVNENGKEEESHS